MPEEEKPPDLQLHPELVRALLLRFRQEFPDLEGVPETDEEAAAVTGMTLEETHTLGARLLPLLLQLDQQIRRERELALREALMEYVGANPGSVRISKKRRFYSQGFQRFLVSLTKPGGPAEGLSTAKLAEITAVPPDTLEGWLQAGR